MSPTSTAVHGEYDVLVIGTGPGGEGAAMTVAKEGRRIAVIDALAQVGGHCTHRGTIPSKALRHAIQQMAESGTGADVRYPALLRHAEEVISGQVSLRRGFYERNRVDVIQGRATFVDPHCVEVVTPAGGRHRYEAGAFVIATGSRPYHPPDLDFAHPRIVDSDTVLRLTDTPRSITIYGAGVIGCEYASIFRGLSIKVNLINTRDKLLSFLDDEIVDALAYHLREQGVVIRHSEEYERVEADDRGVRVHLKSNKVLQSDVLLWAQGRTGNSDDMGLAALGIPTDQRGSIAVNGQYQTAQPHIYAVGDVVGNPSLASAAYDQGRYAAIHLLHGTAEQRLVEDIPTGIYTIPEISSLGATERDLTAQRVPYEVGHASFRSLARAQITGRTTGMLKILFHRDTLRILGIHCFGYQASEIIHIGQAVMSQPGDANTLMYFINTTFNYPTMAEAYRVAALNGYNRVR
jgi:NAD(P) transhydrogenase